MRGGKGESQVVFVFVDLRKSGSEGWDRYGPREFVVSCNRSSSLDGGLFVVVDGGGGGGGDGEDAGRPSNLPITRSIKNAGLSQSRSFGRFDSEEGVGGFLTVRDAAASVSKVTKASACGLPSIGFSSNTKFKFKHSVRVSQT